MSRSKTARRINLLTTSSYVASSILAGMGAFAVTAFSPSLALAACAPDASGTPLGTLASVEVCSGTDTIIDYSGVNGAVKDTAIVLGDIALGETVTKGGLHVDTNTFNLTLISLFQNSSITNDTGGRGIDILTGLPAGDIGIDFTKGANVVVTGDTDGMRIGGGDVVKVNTDAGDSFTGLGDDGVEFNSSVGTTLDANFGGATISGKTTGLNVFTTANSTIVSTGTITASAGDGVWVHSNIAAGTVDLTVATVTGSDDGIQIDAANLGTIKVTTTGIVTGTGSDGIIITGAKAGVTVTAGGAVTGGGATGITATDTSAAGITVTANADVTGATGGIVANEAGTGAVAVNVKNAGTDVIGGAGIGINVDVTTGAATVKSDATTTITGTSGVTVDNTGGAAKLSVNLGGTATGTAGEGIHVFQLGTGGIDVTASGLVTSTGGRGINADAFGGTVSVVSTGGIVTTGEFDGLHAGVFSGTVDVITGAVKSDGNAVNAFTNGGGNVTVKTTAGAILGDANGSGAGDGINIFSLAAGNLEVDLGLNSTVTGAIGIDAATTGAGTIKIGTFGPANTITGTKGDGISAINTGTGQIDVGFGPANPVVNVTGATNGIEAKGGGNVNVLAANNVTGTAAAGITVATTGGNISVSDFLGFPGTIKGGTIGVATDNTSAAGTTTIDTAIDAVVGVTGDGINASGNGSGLIKITASKVDGGLGGVTVSQTGTGSVNVLTTGPVTAGLTAGIQVTRNFGTGAGQIDITANGAIDAQIVGISAIQGANSTGAINITTGAGGDISGKAGTGITANTNSTAPGGNITIVANGDVGILGNGVTNLGIGAVVNVGTNTANISVTGAGSIFSDATGISALNFGSGTTTVAMTGSVTGTGGTGINAANKGGAVTVTTGPGAVSGAAGIVATNTAANGAGAISIHLGADVTGTGQNGVLANTTGAGTVLVNAVGAGTVTGGIDGINASNTSGGAGDVTVDLSAFTTNVQGGQDGIETDTTNGNITILTSGTVKALGGDGINAQTVNGLINIDTGGGAISATSDGIEGYSTGNGDVHINGSSNITTTGGGFVANLLVNGSFSTGTLAGWTQSGNTGFTGVQGGGVDAGFEVFAGPVGSDGFISQTFATAPGQILTINGFYQGDGGVPSNVSLKFNGGTIFSVGNPPGGPFVQVTKQVVATGLDTFTVGFRDDPGFVFVDNFAISQPATSGIFAHTDGNGSLFIGDTGAGYTGNIDPQNGGNGITALVTNAAATGAISIKMAGTISGGAGNGIVADQRGLGTVTVADNKDIGVFGNAVTTDGINATINNALNTNNVFVKFDNNIFAGDDGIEAATNGTGSVSLVVGTAMAANSKIVAGDVGLQADINNATNSKNVTINVGQAGKTLEIDAGRIGVHGATTGTGNVSYNSAGGVTIDPDDFGIEMKSAGGDVDVNTGAGDIIIVDDNEIAGDNNLNYGIYAQSGIAADKAVGNESIEITVAANNQISVGDTSDQGAGGGVGIMADQTGGGTGAIDIQVGNNLLMDVDGDAAMGIIATTNAGTGYVKITTGTGAINVNSGDGTETAASKFTQSGGIVGLSNGGNVTIVNGTQVSVTTGVAGVNKTVGIQAQTVGAGVVDVSTTGTVQSVRGHAIETDSVNGNNTVTVNAALTAVGGLTSNGVDAEVTGTGSILVTSNAAGTIAATGDGIQATITGGGGGSITVTTNGLIGPAVAVGDDGIEATTDGIGLITVTNNAAIKAADEGIHAENFANGAGNVTKVGNVVVNVNANITAVNDGVHAKHNGEGDVTVTQVAATTITSTAGDGIEARIAGPGLFGSDGSVLVTTSGIILANQNGILATSNSNDTVKVQTLAGSQITATNGDGINASVTSAAGTDNNVRVDHAGAILGAGQSGIDISSSTSGDVLVGGSGTIEASMEGILARANSTDALDSSNIVINVSGAIGGTTAVGTNAGQAGIDARITSAANTGNINVTSGAVKAKGDGIHAETIGGGNVTVVTNGIVTGSSGGAFAGADGIDARSSGGNGNVSVTNNAAVFGDPGIFASAVGTGTVTVNANANVTGILDGILTNAVNGTTTVNVNAGTTTGGAAGNAVSTQTSGFGGIIVTTAGGTDLLAGADGINGKIAVAGGSGFNITVNGTIGGAVRVGGDGIDVNTNNTNTATVINTVGAINASTGGILATNTAGSINITSTGAINTLNGFGVNGVTTGAKIVDIDVGAVTTGNGVGVNASSQGGVVTVDNTGFISATTGGITASTIGAGSATVTVGAGITTSGAASDGVTVTTVNGPAVVNQNVGTINANGGGDADGVILASTTGPVTFTGAAATSINASSDGITANTAGTIVVTENGAMSAGADAIRGVSTGSTVQVTTGGGAITGGTNGIVGQSTGGGAVTVTTGAGTVTGTNGIGVSVASNGGLLTVTSAGLVTGASGIVANETGGGAIDINVNNGVLGTNGDAIKTDTNSTGATTIDTFGTVAGVNGDGIDASSNGGHIFVNTNGPVLAFNGNGIIIDTVGAGLTSVHSFSTVDASVGAGITAAAGTGGSTVTADQQVTGFNGGIIASATGVGNVTVTAHAGVFGDNDGDGVGDGIKATAVNGNIIVQADSTVQGNNGVVTDTATGTTTINVVGKAWANFGAATGDGVHATTAGSGVINITTGQVDAVDDGISAVSTGGSNINVTNTGAVSGDSPANGVGNGIDVRTTSGGILNVTLGGTVSGANGIWAENTTNGAGAINILDGNAAWTVTGTSGDGIHADGGTGNVSVGLGAGQRIIGAVSGTQDGIDASGLGLVQVFTAGNVTGTAGDGIVALSTGAGGSVTVDVSKLAAGTTVQGGDDGIDAKQTAGGPVTVTTTAIIEAVNDTGIFAQVTGGSGAVVVNSFGTAINQAFTTSDTGINAQSDTGSIAVDNKAAIGKSTAGFGQDVAGIIAKQNGAGASTNVTVTNKADIWVDAGGSWGIYAGIVGAGSSGNVLITNTGKIDPAAFGEFATGPADVTVDNSGAILAGVGIHAESSGNATKTVLVKNSGGVGATITGTTGNGIEAVLLGAGTPNITVDAGAGGAIFGTNGIVTFTNGAGVTNITTTQQVTGNGADGIHASTIGNGVINITTGPVVGTDDGIEAQSGGGSNINVTTNGFVQGVINSGIKTDTTTGATVIVANANVQGGPTGDGVQSTSTSGNITVTTNGSAIGGNDGIQATSSAGGTVIVNNNGTTTGGTGSGVNASSTTGNVTVNVAGATSGVNGVQAATTSGTINVNDAGGFALTGTAGDGINAVSTLGAVNIGSGAGNRINGVVTGTDDGIEASGGTNVQVWTGANVTGDSDNSGLQDGIRATSTGAGTTVLVNSTGGIIHGGDDGIEGIALGALSTVTIVNTDNVETRDDANIAASATTGAISVTNSGNLGATVFAAGSDFGINAQSTTGGIVISNTGALIGNVGGVPNGLDIDGIRAVSTGANITGVTVTNSAAIHMDNGADAGIRATNVGTGTVTVNNTGAIDPAAFGIFASGGGDVIVNNAADILANTGIHADSTSVLNANKVDVFQRAPGAQITALTGNGIEASIVGNGTVNVGGPAAADRIQGNITATAAGANGILATGQGNVNVFTGAGTIAGNIWGIKAQSTPGGAGLGGAVNVNTIGTVTGVNQGILATTNGTDATDTTTVTVGGNVTAGNGRGVQASAINGLTKVDLNVGTIIATNGDGIRATSSGTGGVTVNTALGTDVQAATATFNDITAITTGASGDINVTVLGTLSLPNFAGNDAIFAQVNNAASTSNINISSQNRIWGSNVAANTGMGIEATSNGLGSITISANTTAAPTGNGVVFGGLHGINATLTNPAGGGNIGVTAGNAAWTTSISSQDANGSGITAKNSGTGSTTVTLNPNVNVQATGANSIGVDAEATSGAVTVTTNGGTINATLDDILAVTNGVISVTNNDTLLSATDAGIRATGGTGTVTVLNNGSMASLTNANYGIIANDTTGQITVTNNGQIGSAGLGNGVNFIGIQAFSAGANAVGITVNNNNLIFVDNGGFAGILAQNNGTGDVVVNNTAAIDPPAYGIYATGGGNVTVNTSANVTGNTGIHADSFGVAGKLSQVNVTNNAVITGLTLNGIENFSTAGANVGVNTTAGGNVVGGTNGIVTNVTGGGTTGTTTINTLTSANSALIKNVTGASGDGINAATTGSGAMTITTGNVSGAGLNTSSGINASSTGGSAITVATTGTVTGDLTGNAAGTGAAGIRAVTTGGNGSVVVTSTPTTNVVTGGVNGGNYGIIAASTGTGSTSVTTTVQVLSTGAGTVNAGTGPVGIQAVGGTGGVIVNVGPGTLVNNTAATGRGIVTDSTSLSATAGQINIIGSTSAIRGLGDATHAVIDITNSGVSGRTVLTNNGLIQSVNATPAAYGDLAITGKTVAASTGGTTINNNSGGVINGRLVFSGNQNTANVLFTNASGGIWHTTGASVLSGIGAGNTGADTISNTGQIFTNNAGTATSIDFGAGADTFNNNAGGVLVAGEAQVAASASNLVLSNLETFNNNGQIFFGGTTSASDNAFNDKINAAGALFGGTGKLFMDADLWSTPQASCAALTAADCMAVGSTTGLNSIVVNDVNAHAVGSFNPNGIALVTGSTNAGANFKLDPTSEWYNAAKFGGVLDKPGLFFYDLAWSAANGGTSLLIGVPDTEVFELAELGNAAQSIWYSSTQTWFDRQADLRQSLAGRQEGWAPGVWLKVVGNWGQRDNITTFSLFNKVYAFDVGYTQDTVGLIGGVDFLSVRDGDEAYVFGAQLGYMDSDVRFVSPTRTNFSGTTIGLYGTYMNGGFFLDAIANANFLDMHHYVPTLPAPPAPGSANADATTYGGQVELGYQMAIGATGFWEPLASVAYSHTEIDTLNLGPSGSVDFPSTVSFRGSLGARIGMSGDFQYYKVRVALTGRLWDEFDGNNTTVVIAPGPSNFFTNDDFGGTFGEVSVSGNLFTVDNHLSAFANAGVKFRSNWQDTNVTVGFRYQW